MPRGDRTGPLGQGELAGRQLGYCAGYDVPGYAQDGFYGCSHGRGLARGGQGRVFRRGVRRGGGPQEPAMGPPANEAVQLKGRIGQLERTLGALKQRLETLSGEAED
ncbi:MAG: DUF5320 domain-containing protein [Desulfuromonadaceae bacterium]|nr:DUF5320 domain-containing protein [Desulfuromonadaceae bacterium]